MLSAELSCLPRSAATVYLKRSSQIVRSAHGGRSHCHGLDSCYVMTATMSYTISWFQ